MPPKPWHNTEADADARNNLVEYIVELLKLRRPNATGDWADKLPQMAKRLDDALYFSANSKQEYVERSTLKHRLQQLALAMGGPKNNQTKPGGGGGGDVSVPTSVAQQQHQAPAHGLD